MAPPAFSDIAKPANDILNKDFYHASAATLEVKLKAPDGLAVTTKGVSTHNQDISGAIEAKKVIQKGMKMSHALLLPIKIPSSSTLPLEIWTTVVPMPEKYSQQRSSMRRAGSGSGSSSSSRIGGGNGHRRPKDRVSKSSDATTESVSMPTMSPLPSPRRDSPVAHDVSRTTASPSLQEEAEIEPDPAPRASSAIPASIASPPALDNTPLLGTLCARLKFRDLGITATSTWNNANIITAKVELDDVLAPGVKAEYVGTIAPKAGLKAQKGNLYFKQGAFHVRAFGDFNPATGNVNATVDGVVAHEGFLVGGEAGFDVQKAALTRYSAAFGYQTPIYSAAITATNSLSVFAASYYHRVNPAVEAGVKAAYDTKTNAAVGIEVATKYKIDPTAFAKVKLNDKGIVSLAYNARINSGFTFGIGASLDAQKLNEAGHKVGTSFVFEG